MLNSKKAPQAPVNFIGGSEDLMEAQLQQELLSMFEVDTQKGLQAYLDQASHLQSDQWNTDIQTLYRAIHTIKGGAVTVGADAILQVATVLEDLLSDLRRLETAPPLEDGQLTNMLVEAGELLASASLIKAEKAEARSRVEPSVQRIHWLRSHIQACYLPHWSPQEQIQQEFVQQGFDLVVLDLEIALENLTVEGALPEEVLQTGRSLVEQLRQIGNDLELSAGWRTLLQQAEILLERRSVEIWQTQWPRLFQALKGSIRRGSEPVSFTLVLPEEAADPAATSPLPQSAASDATAGIDGAEAKGSAESQSITEISWAEISGAAESESDDESDNSAEVSDVLTDVGAFLDELGSLEDLPTALQDAADEEAQDEFLGEAEAAQTTAEAIETLAALDWAVAETMQDSLLEEVQATPAEPSIEALLEPVDPAYDLAIVPPTESDAAEQVQIPVPLERLDRSAQDLVDALLSVRSTQGIYNVLQNQILQLSSLAQEGVQYITRLRQIQDDYALVDTLNDLRQTGPEPERYRQGYVTINRLLETSLRLSELGAETEKSAKEMTESLQVLDGNVLKLQATVEESRLVPFRNLAFRTRAILRDLTTRFDKPVKLTIQGERTELDVGSARSLEPALLHLIRNAFSHAIEPLEERQSLGKPKQGTLSLSLQRLGNVYRLSLQDDGRGIDAQAIRDRALDLDLPRSDTSTSANLLAVICQPGFSSNTDVSALSGRGVGMDVVAAQIDKMGGKLTLETSLGQGTTFSLQFPVPHLLVSCLLLRAGDRTFALPFEDTRSIALLETLEATPTQQGAFSWQIKADGEVLPGLDLLDYWQPQTGDRALEETAVCTYVQLSDGGQGVWLIADDLLGQSDLLISALPTPLQAPEGVMGVSLQTDGTLVPVLNVAAIVDHLRARPQSFRATSDQFSGQFSGDTPDSAFSTPTILIVDDAALMRRRIEASLNSHGHPTHTCADGLEAWNWLKANPAPALVITDIEMPNMDGFTLIDRCRQEDMPMPILVVSSRLSEDWFAEAQRLGANDYLTKGFSTVELLNKVNHLATSEV